MAAGFPLLFIKPCSDNILMYGMQHIERLAKIVFGIKRDNSNKGFFFLEFSDTASKGHYDKEFVVDFPFENVEV